MGLSLEADYKSPPVKRPGGNYCLRQASTKEVVEAVRSSAFASPGSPLVYTSLSFFADYE